MHARDNWTGHRDLLACPKFSGEVRLSIPQNRISINFMLFDYVIYSFFFIIMDYNISAELYKWVDPTTFGTTNKKYIVSVFIMVIMFNI